MLSTSERIMYKSEAYNNDIYWERVNRSLGWLGSTEEEQKQRQKKLRDAVVGIAGTGGIGGALAARLVRMGVRNLKLADLDHLGKNKAEVVAEMTFNLTRDVNIEVYPEGITPDSAKEFMKDCDYVLDQMDFYEIRNRYALHRAFRESNRCKFMLKVPTVGHGTYIFKYTKDSMPIEEVYGIPEDAVMSPEVIKRLMERLIPEMPFYPKQEMLDHWFIDLERMPIFAGCPPLAEGVLAERLALAITELDQLPGVQQLPVQPGYAMFDTMTWQAKIVHGKWWAE